MEYWSEFPRWASMALGAAISGLFLLAVGFLKARTDQTRTRSTDRIELQTQTLDWAESMRHRVEAMEKQLADERDYCNQRMAEMEAFYKAEIERQRAVIERMEARIMRLENHDDQQ